MTVPYRHALAALFLILNGLPMTSFAQAPNITATKTDSTPAATKKNPGETVTYTNVISNAAGAGTATGLQFTDPDVAGSAVVASSVKVSPIAFDDVYTGVIAANTTIDTATSTGFNILNNDFKGLAAGATATLAISTINVTSANGGTVVIAAGGTFSYSPAPGFVGSDSFNYTITNNSGTLSNTGSVSLTVSGPVVWYVNAGTGNDTTGNGTLAKPFATVNKAATMDAANHKIFVATGTYAATAVTLESGEMLIGQGSGGGTFDAFVLELTPTLDTLARPILGATRPTLSGGTVITLAAGNTIRGVDLNSTAAGSAISGSNIATATIGGSPVDTFITASSGGTSGVNLNGGTGAITIHAPINATAGAPLSIANRTGGTVTINGKVSSSGSASALNLAANGTTTINLHSVVLAPGFNTAFSATGSGTLTLVNGAADGIDNDGNGGTDEADEANTLATTTGTALNLNGVTIGASHLTFQSIASNGGTAAGIIIRNTSSSPGTIFVTGTGTAGSGGTIQSKTGGDVSSGGLRTPNGTTDGTGIYLGSAGPVSLDRMNLQGFSNFAVYANGATGFKIDHSTISGNNGDNVAQDEGGMRLLDLTGTCSFLNSTFGGNSISHVVRVVNTSGTLGLTVSGSTFTNPTLASGDDGLFFEAGGTATITANVLGNTFTANRGDHFQAAALNSGNLNISFKGNTLTGGHATALGAGVTINAATGVPGYAGAVNYDIDGNTFNGSISNAVIVNLGTSSSAASFNGFIRNNVIGTAGSAKSGSLQANGIGIDAHGNGTHTCAVTANTIIEAFDRGISVLVNDGTTGVLNLTVQGNDLDQSVSSDINGSRESFFLNNGSTTTNVFGQIDAAIVRLNFGGAGGLANLLDHGVGSTDDFRVRQRFQSRIEMPGYAGSPFDNAAVVAYLSGRNTLSGGATASATSQNDVGSVNDGYFAASSVPFPSATPLPLLFAENLPETSRTAIPTEDRPGVSPAIPAIATMPEAQPVTTAALQAGQLDSLVAEAITRWEATGLTERQMQILRRLRFELGDLDTLHLGQADGDLIRISPRAAGNEWFIDSTPADDTEFSREAAVTRRAAVPNGAALNRVDLLTTLLHEMGHALGLCDSYSNLQRESLMYGFLGKGERRLPSMGQALGATPHEHNEPHFLAAPIDIGVLPPGKSVTIIYDVVINDPLTTVPLTSQGTVSGTNFTAKLTDDLPSVGDPALPGASDPTVTLIERPDTTVASLNRTAANPTNATSVTWQIVFANPIDGLAVGNFSLVNTGLGGTPAITGVAAVGTAPTATWNITATTGTGDGTLGLNLVNDGALTFDVTNQPFTGQVYTIDRSGPGATIVLADSALKTGDTSLVTITFTEATSGFDNSDLIIPNGTLTAVTTSDNITWTASLTPDGSVTDTTNIITLDKTGVTDALGNAGTGTAVSANYAVDTALPTAGIEVADTTLRAGETSLVTITFNEAVTGFTNADLTIANGTLSAVSSGDGGVTWTATLTPTAGITDPSNLITLDNSGVADSSGNAGTGTTDSNNYAIDTLRPTATVFVADTALAAGETSLVTITFSEAVTGFTTADLTVSNGTVTGLSTSDGGITWTATLTPAASIEDASNLITLDNSGLTDIAGNSGTGTTDSNNYAIDTLRPTATVVVADTALAAGETSLVTLTFNEAITGLNTADLTVANGSVSGLTSSDGGITWTGTLTPNASVTDISNLITLDNAGVQDAAGNTGNGTTDSNNYAIDTARPTATLVVADDNLLIGETSLVTITFSEAVTGFSNADLTIPNGTLTAVSTGDGGITWTATFTPTPNITAATNVITLDNTGVQDAAGNTGTGSTDSNNFAITSLSVSIAANAASAAEGTGAGNTAFTFTISRTGSTTGDVTMDYAVTGAANATDFGGTLPSGQFAIPNGQASAVLTINASRDSTVEPDEAFTVTLSNASGGFVISTAAASSTITNDDFEADLAITVTDGVATAVPGSSVTYTITASNAGPHPATGATLVDTFPAALSNVTWTSVGAGGGSATAAGSGNINDTVNLPVGASVTYTVNATLSAAATGTLVNTATVSSAVTDPNPANNSATDTDTLTPQADLSITKTDGVATAIPGGSVTYTITASNSGPSDVIGATLADTIPASLTTTWTAVGAGGGSAPANGAGNINALVNLPVGGSVTFTVSATISSAATGTLVNTATIGSAVTDPNPANNSATDTDTLTPQADLAITKTDGVTTAVPGSSVTYTITASNSGLSNVTGATVSDTFPASLTGTWTAVGAGGGSAPASGSGNINAPVTLPPGGSVTFTVSATISATATGNLSNTATVTAPAGVTDPNPGNNSATDTDTLTPQADLTITKTDGVTTATPGGSVTYTITASNAGPSSVPTATVADTLPASIIGATWTATGAGGGTATAAGAGNINDTVNLPVGGSVTYTVTAPISAAATGTLVNTATVSSAVTDPTPANNSAIDTDTLNAQADLAITKTDGITTATPGTSVTYTITASNAGPSNVTGATVADTLPAIISGATWTATGAGGGTGPASGSGNISASNINLPAGGSFTFTVTAPISAAATGTLVNTATVSSAVTDPTPGNNSATDTDTLTPQADLAVTMTDSPDPVIAGDNLTYTITVTNNGPSYATTVSLTDALPPGMTFVSLTSPGWTSTTPPVGGSGMVTSTIASFPPTSASFTLVVKVSSALPAGTVLSNTATVSTATTDPTPGNNAGTATTTLTAQADLALTITDSPEPVNAGGDLTYTIVLTNNGPSTAVSPTVSLPLPASTTFVSAPDPVTWITTKPAVGGTGTVSFTTASLASGGTATFTVVAKVDLTVVNNSTLTATATAASATTDPTPANDSATATTLAKSGADLQITLADSSDPVVAGTNLTYTLGIANNGPLDADNVSVTDTLPAGTTFVSLTAPAGWTATTPAVGGTGSVTITRPLFAVSGSATFTLVVKVGPGVANGTVITDTAAVTSTTVDIVPGNNSATTTSTVTTQSDLAIQISGTPATAPKGSNVTYAITLTNNGPSDASAPNVSLPIPSQMTFVSATSPAGWSATTPAVGANGTVNFSAASLASGATVNFTVVAKVNANAPTGAILTAIVTASATGVEPVPADNVAATVAAVGTVKPAAVQPVTTGIKVNAQTGLFDINVKVTNTTPLPINGFRLRVNFDAYKAAYPSLRLENATSTSKKNNVYIDYPNAMAVNATVTVKLSFYTSTRTFPSPFTPVLTVDLLATAQAAPILGGGVQASLATLPDKTVQLAFPTVAGRWYRVSYSSDLVHWTDCQVPVMATAGSTSWLDNGPPYTVETPANTPARFYLVHEIEAP